MFAINHAATALLIKRRFPEEPIIPLLLSVQLMELVWVGLNLLGIERNTTEPSVASVSDIHLAFMPYSHSVVMSLAYGFAAWILLTVLLHRPSSASLLLLALLHILCWTCLLMLLISLSHPALKT